MADPSAATPDQPDQPQPPPRTKRDDEPACERKPRAKALGDMPYDGDDDDEWPKHSLYGPDVDEDKIARGGISSGEDSPNTSVNKQRSREPNQAAAAASAAAAKRIAAKKLDTPPRARRNSAPHIDIRPPTADAAAKPKGSPASRPTPVHVRAGSTAAAPRSCGSSPVTQPRKLGASSAQSSPVLGGRGGFGSSPKLQPRPLGTSSPPPPRDIKRRASTGAFKWDSPASALSAPPPPPRSSSACSLGSPTAGPARLSSSPSLGPTKPQARAHRPHPPIITVAMIISIATPPPPPPPQSPPPPPPPPLTSRRRAL